MASRADENLLLGMLALQMGFVSRDAVIGAMQAWTFSRAKPLGQILIEQGALTHERLALIEPLVAEHLRQHDGDPQRSLAAVGVATELRHELVAMGDAEVSSSLAGLTCEPFDDSGVERTMPFRRPVSDRFEILRPHAAGGLGAVYVAHDNELNREIALKEIHTRLANNTSSRLRFVQEAEITGRLEHPGIVPVYGLGQYEDGRPFYAMKFIRGETLKHAIERFHGTSYSDSDSPATQRAPTAQAPSRTSRADMSNHSLEFRELLGRFVDVCNTVSYAHSRGVLHRDLKPSNIMLGSFGETLVVDWGLAKTLGAKELANAPGDSDESWITPSPASGLAETMAGSAIGTPAFMSPEQAVGRLDELGPATDVYGLGATLYCLLTGVPPFTGGYVGETLQRVQNGAFPPPRAVQPQIPRPLEAICLMAMSLKRSDRYPTARELAADLEHWLADEPVLAWQESRVAKAARWSRRHRAIVASAAALFMAASISAAVGVVVVNREQVRTQHAEAQANVAAQLADSQARTATEVSQFLIGMFEEPTPFELFGLRMGNRQLDPATRVLLDRGTTRLTESLNDQPLVKAAMLAAIGRARIGTGETTKAVPLLEEALAIHRRLLGPNDPLIGDDAEKLGFAYLFQDRLSESEAAARECLRIRRSALPETHALVVRAKGDLGGVLGIGGYRLQEAEKLLRDVLDVRQKTLDSNDPRIAEAMMSLGGTLSWGDKPLQAVAMIGPAFQILGTHEEIRELTVIMASVFRAQLIGRLGQKKQGMALGRENVRNMASVLGEDHPLAAYTSGYYAYGVTQAGDEQEARAACDAMLSRYQSQGVPWIHIRWMSLVLKEYRRLLVASGDGEKLESVLRGVLLKQREMTKYKSPNSPVFLSNLIALLHTLGRQTESQALVTDFLAVSNLLKDQQSICGGDHFVAIIKMLVEVDRLDDAATIARLYIAGHQELLANEPRERVAVYTAFGHVLNHQRRFDQAEPMLANACAIANETVLSGFSRPLLDPCEAWATALEGLNRSDQAEKVLRESVNTTLKAPKSKSTSDQLLRVMNRLGHLYLRQGRSDEAKQQFEATIAAGPTAVTPDQNLLRDSEEQLMKLSAGASGNSSVATEPRAPAP